MVAIMGPSCSGKTTLLKAVFLIESSFIALAEALR
jgi:ABC-type lipoprotein export system ATPase subunit